MPLIIQRNNKSKHLPVTLKIKCIKMNLMNENKNGYALQMFFAFREIILGFFKNWNDLFKGRYVSLCINVHKDFFQSHFRSN